MPISFHIVVWLMTIYFFEYSNTNGFADRMKLRIIAKAKAEDPNWVKEGKTIKDLPFGQREFFLLMQLSYQLGVTISKGSLQYLQIDRIYMLTVLQALNSAFLFLNTYYLWITTIYFMIPFFIWVGLMGGATYVNVMFKLLSMEELSNEDKQSALVISLMFQETGKILSSCFVLLMSNTIFKV